MMFANPWGFLALLGIPAVLVIHALRRSPEKYLTNTLFLIEARLRDPGGGRRLRRLRRSFQLWLRLLMVGLIALVLAKPTTVREDSTQRIVIVIDTTASMSAARKALATALTSTLLPWSKQVANTEWIVLGSLPDAPQLYRGWGPPDGLLDQVAQLELQDASHDPSRALGLALELANDNGRVLFVSDHLPQPPLAGIGVLAVGSMVQNVGWCGVDVSPDGSWEAILRNYGNSRQRRKLTGANGAVSDLQLEAGEWRNVSGMIPVGEMQATATLTDDNFTADDQLYLVRPRQKVLTWTGAAPPPALEKLFAACGLDRADGATADVELRSNDLLPAGSEYARLLIPTTPADTAPYVRTPATAATHPLTEGLIFDGLLWRRCAPLNPPLPGDSVLLWSGTEPLAILRPNTLELGFHPGLSNFDRAPAALVLIQRWLDSVRAAKIAVESRQLLVGDRVEVAANPSGNGVVLKSARGRRRLDPAALISLRVPDQPGALSIMQGDVPLLEAAINFFDPIEADFNLAEVGLIPPPQPAAVSREALRPDRLRDLWLLLALAVVLLTWAFPESGRKPQPI